MLASTRKVEFDQTLAQLIHFVAGGTFLAGFFKAMLQTMPFKNPFDVWSLICKYSTARAWLLYYRKKKMSFNLRLSSACIVHLRTAKNFIKPKKSLNEHFRLYPTHKPESLKNSHKLRKSIHPRKFGNHVIVHRLPDLPSVLTTGIPMFNLTLSS